jgi:hypothetical protein
MALNTTRLTRFRRQIRSAISEGLQLSAEQAADLASQLAPYDAAAQHKHLNESIVVRGQPGGLRWQVVAGEGLPDARAVWNEYGTRDMGAAPYLAPSVAAIDAKRNVAEAIERLARS